MSINYLIIKQTTRSAQRPTHFGAIRQWHYFSFEPSCRLGSTIPTEHTKVGIRNHGPMEFPMDACVEDDMGCGNKVAGTGAIVQTMWNDLGFLSMADRQNNP